MAHPAEVALWILRAIWVTLNNLYAIPVSLVWLTLLSPLALVQPELFWQIEGVFFSWLSSMVACWTWSAGYEVAESGADLDLLKHKNLLLMPNHQSTADVPLLMTIFASRVGFCNKVMWIMDKVFKFTNFGVVSWMHDDFFILAGRNHRDSSLVHLKRHLSEVFIPKQRKYLVVFPEGGFLHKRKEASNRFAAKLGLPPLEHCTLPRTGALDVIMAEIGPWSHPQEEPEEGKQLIENEGEKQDNVEKDVGEKGEQVKEKGDEAQKGSKHATGSLEYLVDVTVAYPEGKALDLQSIVTGWRQPCITHVHYRVFPVRNLPRSSEELKNWMIKLYQEKEDMLDTFYRTGEFPYNHFEPTALRPKNLYHDPLRYLVIHTFFLFSNYLFYCLAITLGVL
jgi:lysophosphatidylglycerol acyltransferase 1